MSKRVRTLSIYFSQLLHLTSNTVFWGIRVSKKETNLFRSTGLNEVLINLLSFAGLFQGGLGLFEILTSLPELNIFITELRSQKALKGGQTIYGIKKVWKSH